MRLSLTRWGLSSLEPWRALGYGVPEYDLGSMKAMTQVQPQWVHFGPGNLFRAFLAPGYQTLLNRRPSAPAPGIIAVSAHNAELVDQVYRPHDNLFVNVEASADGTLTKELVASVAEALVCSASRPADETRLKQVFASPSLQMVTFTITEKGYATTDSQGQLTPQVAGDLDRGPSAPDHGMAKVAALMLHRFFSGQHPVALVSLDNCSRNGDQLKKAILSIASGWASRGLVPQGFVTYLENPAQVSFPWTMIDKITPQPSEAIERQLETEIADISRVRTENRGSLAPFVNAEATQYLFIEDAFPNGRPALETSRGVWFCDRDTVHRVETMKVTTCLNPIHTAIAVTGQLLGYTLVSEAMKDSEIHRLVERIGFDEGLPVAIDPGIIHPKDFLHTVITERLTNPFLPDTTARIATDTSLKVGIRYGETIKAWQRTPGRRAQDLTGIPLVLACWFRYLAGVDDQGHPLKLSPDPLQEELLTSLGPVSLGGPAPKLAPWLGRSEVFGTDLTAAGLGDKIQNFYVRLLAGPGAVREVLRDVLR